MLIVNVELTADVLIVNVYRTHRNVLIVKNAYTTMLVVNVQLTGNVLTM